MRCAVMYHVPCEGQKRIVRTDTGEQVREEAMTEAEKQLNLFAAQAEFDEFMRRQAIGDAKTPKVNEPGSEEADG